MLHSLGSVNIVQIRNEFRQDNCLKPAITSPLIAKYVSQAVKFSMLQIFKIQ